MLTKKHFFILTLLFFFHNSIQAQKTINRESNYGNSNDSELPLWVREMCKPNANLFLVKAFYESYFKTNPFLKNKHTQLYKCWVHSMQNMVHENGVVQYPN